MKYQYTEKKDTRSGFGDGLTSLGRSHPEVVALCADLVGSLKMANFINSLNTKIGKKKLLLWRLDIP